MRPYSKLPALVNLVQVFLTCHANPRAGVAIHVTQDIFFVCSIKLDFRMSETESAVGNGQSDVFVLVYAVVAVAKHFSVVSLVYVNEVALEKAPRAL